MKRLNEYQEEALVTATYPGRNELPGLVYTILGLSNEAGEVAGKLKKHLRGDDGTPGVLPPERRDALMAELGDVLWYLAVAADELDVSLQYIAEMNIRKIRLRQERGTIQGDGDDR